ncbi:hypothetical protein FIBSPDRAFT_1052392 [Athelia psychrophila]|uniref:Ubiquitin-like domain-containing protein n=1 Tax=Athelia psychrophila TaxID=1759441 RepID=A0A165XCV7_9AGAM|nr:hypothetical protein FIBSPDRAFT_1052392 [Fibularhizoctonia sp. CBS 109695]
MVSLPNLEEPDPTTTTFNTGHTSGMVQNVNHDFIVHGGLTYTVNCIVEGPLPDMKQLLEVLPKIYTTPTVAPSSGVEGHTTVCGPITAQMAATHVTMNNFKATSAKDSSIEIRVIAEMMDILLENPSLHHSDTLPETLVSLRRMLKLTELALRAYQQTPLAQTLNYAIIAEAERCHKLLKDLFKRLSDYRYTLPAGLFQFIRQYIWSTAGESLEFSELNSKLGRCHSSLAACILALGSAAWPELERGKEGKTALADFYSLFAQESASLRHIQVDTVIVIDHLGRNLPVPTIFCNSWQDFHTVIVGHSKSFAGDSLVQRGDYMILKQGNDQVITPEELSSTIRPGITVEMSIVLREQAPEEYGGTEHKCPRCSHMNSKVITPSGWVSCQRCCGNFQVLSHTEDGDGDEEELVSPDADGDGDEQELISPEAQQLEPDHIPYEHHFFRRICIKLADTKTLPPSTAAAASSLSSPVDHGAESGPDSGMANIVSAKRAREAEREAKEREFAGGQHANYIDGIWHCSNCGCPDDIAIGRRRGPLGDKSQCGPCGKYWHRHRAPAAVEYNSSAEFLLRKRREAELARTMARNKGGAAASRAHELSASTSEGLSLLSPSPSDSEPTLAQTVTRMHASTTAPPNTPTT